MFYFVLLTGAKTAT